MPRLIAFNSVSLDGFFADASGGLDWAHGAPSDPEWNAFVSGNASGDGRLVFGRVTYDMMAASWPTPEAKARMPVVAARMNGATKFVFSRTMQSASWAHTTVLHEDPVAAMRRLKADGGPDLVILGSGSLVSRLAPHGLIDELQLVVVPVVLGAGKPLFSGLTRRLPLRLTSSRAFGNGNVVLAYAPAG